MASPSTAHTGAGRDDHDQPRVAALRGRPDRRVHGHPRTTLTSLAGRRQLAADTGPHSQADAQSRMALRHDARTRARSRLRPCHIPVRDDTHRLVGLRRYQPWRAPGEPKMLAAPGSHRALLPHPAAEASEQVPLVEGEPDMIAARSRGLPAVAVPGVDGWRTAWASLFAGWRVVEVMHCDEDGRAAAAITNDIKRVRPAGALDRAPQRLDGHDLTDQLPRGERLEIHWP